MAETTQGKKERSDSDRERILVNIASLLAHELAHLQGLPEVQRYMANPHSLSLILCESGFVRRPQFKKGDLAVCQTSLIRQQNPYLVSFVEETTSKNDASGMVLRAIGTDQLCDYGNEAFIKISGIPERLLWEGEKHEFAAKLSKAFRKLDDYTHRFRGLEFDATDDHLANVFVGDVFGGSLGDKKSRPYKMTLRFNKRTSVAAIIREMKAQGYGTRKFELDDGSYEGPMQGCSTFTRDSLKAGLEAVGIQLKESAGKAVNDEG